MKQLSFALIILLFSACAKDAAIDQEAAMEELKSLAGTWQMQPDVPNFDYWDVNGQALGGITYSVNDGDTTKSQMNKIEIINDTVTYTVVLLLGEMGKTIDFKLVEQRDNKYIFEAQNHEFPKRITYLLRDNVINEFREGKIAGNYQEMELKYKRVE